MSRGNIFYFGTRPFLVGLNGPLKKGTLGLGLTTRGKLFLLQNPNFASFSMAAYAAEALRPGADHDM